MLLSIDVLLTIVMKVKGLILSMDLEVKLTGEVDLENCNSDVIVIVEEENEYGIANLEKYVAPFFTFKNLKTIVRQNQESGLFLKGKYFWASRMVLIDKMEVGNIRRVIDDIIDEGDFSSVFQKL